MQMPPWIGMETYSNFWGADFPVTAPSDPAPGMPGLERGAVLIYFTAFVDGAAVLKDPTTAVVDACFDGIDSLAAAVRNTVGEGRVAWLSAYGYPRADTRGNEYTTEAYTDYLEALYAWLDHDGPRGTP